MLFVMLGMLFEEQLCELQCIHMSLTGTAVPAPVNVTAELIGPTSVKISWDLPDKVNQKQVTVEFQQLTLLECRY